MKKNFSEENIKNNEVRTVIFVLLFTPLNSGRKEDYYEKVIYI